MPPLLAFLLAGPEPIAGIPANAPTCTIARAQRVSFETAHRDLERLRGRCVAIRGIVTGRALYQGGAAARAPRAEYDAATAGQRVGLYGSRPIERGEVRPDAYVAVGLLQDCGRFWTGEAEVMGYCHHVRDGPFLIVTQLRRRTWPTLRGIW